MKKMIPAAAMLLAALVLSGCTTDYDRGDIEVYVKSSLELTNFSVSESYDEVLGEDGYTDHLWTIMTLEGICFHVLDDYYYGMESTTNILWNDYSSSVFMAYMDELPESSLLDNGNILITTMTGDEGYNEVTLEGYYSNKSELQMLLDQLDVYHDFFVDLGYDRVDLAMSLTYLGPESYPYRGRLVGEYGMTRLQSDKDEDYAMALRKYILMGLDYGFDEVLADVSEDEIREAILTADTDRVGIVREDGHTEYYDDLIGNSYSYGLSVSTLYKILEREGFAPEGDRMHFKCTGVDGVVYEFGYDFCDEVIDGQNCAYYLADGEIRKLGYAYNSHINAYEASRLFGIQIVTKWNKTIAAEKRQAYKYDHVKKH